MRTHAQTAYQDSAFADEVELQRAGSALENPFVYDATARELKVMACAGLIEVLDEHHSQVGSEDVIDRFRFRRPH